MPAISQDASTVKINNVQYRIIPGSLHADDTSYFAQQRRYGRPKYEDFSPENVISWSSWHFGYGNFYYNTQTPDNYYQSNGVDASIEQQLTLSLAVGTTAKANGVPVGDTIHQFPPDFNGEQYAVGSVNLYYWQPTASPNGWVIVTTGGASPGFGEADIFAVNPVASTAGVPGGNYLILGDGSSQYFIANASTSYIVATRAQHFQTVGLVLWKAYTTISASPVQVQWNVAKTADGVTYGAGNTFQPYNGVATITGMLDYDNQMYLFTNRGFSAINISGAYVDLVPEIGEFGSPDVGKANAVFHGIAWFSSNAGLMSFDGSNVLNPQTLQTVHSLGPDQQSHSQSPVRGKFRGLAPHTNYLYGTMDSQAGDGYLMKYRDYPGLQPGDGWHSIQRFAGQTMGAVKVSAVVPSAPELWVSSGGNIYHSRLPAELDNPLVDSSVIYQTTGTFDLPVIDLDMPTVIKYWYKMIVDAQQAPSTSISLNASFDFGPQQLIAQIPATSGILEFDFSIVQGLAYRIQPQLVLATATNGQTPVVRGLALHHYLRPLFRQQWSMQIDLQEGNLANQVNYQQIESLKAARKVDTPQNFVDLFGQSHAVMFEKLDIGTTGERDPQLAGPGSIQYVASVLLQDLGTTNIKLWYWDDPTSKFDDLATWA